jgi:hypothetical protein
MGLGNRTSRRHETVRTAGVNPEEYWDFKPGQTVMTVDGFLGKVIGVNDGAFAGSEEYEVLLHNGLGGGLYTSGQLKAATDHTATENTASKDYPELADILRDRPDPGKYPDSTMGMVASLQVEAAEGGMAYICKGCGARSPAGIGYAANGQTDFPESDPHCPGPHDHPWGDSYHSGEDAFSPDYSQGDPFAVLHYRPRHEAVVGPMDSGRPCIQCAAHGMFSCQETVGKCDACENPRTDIYRYRSGGYESKPESLCLDCIDTGHHMESAHDQDEADVDSINHLARRPPGQGGFHPIWKKTSLDPFDRQGSLGLTASLHPVEAEVGGAPGLCENGHLTWGGQCASCRNTPEDSNAIVTNPGDHKPQDVENVKNAARDQVGTGYEHLSTDELGDEVQRLRDTEDSGSQAAVLAEMHNRGLRMDDLAHRLSAKNAGLDEDVEDWHDEDDNQDWEDQFEEPERQVHCQNCGQWKGAETGYHAGNDGPCPNKPKTEDEVFDTLDPDKYCGEHCQSGHAADIVHGVGGHHTFQVGEPEHGEHGTLLNQTTGPYDEPAERDSRYEVRDPDTAGLCRYCRSPLPHSPLRELDNIGTPAEHAFLKSNPTGPTRYSALEYGWAMLKAASLDPSLAFHLTATWHDVRNKAKRIRSEGGVHITTAQNGYYIATVKGDHGTYESVLMRAPGSQKVAQWDCGCKWAQYHWGAPDDFSRFAGRMCSHALALTFEAQSQGMFGREVKPHQGVPRWLNTGESPTTSMERGFGHGTRLDVPTGVDRVAALVEPQDDVEDVVAAEESHTGDRMPHRGSFLQTFALLAVEAGETPENVARLLSVVGAVNSPFGEPGPAPVPGISPAGPTEKRRQENPAQAGFLTAADPDSWGQQNPQDLGDRMAAREIPGLGCPHCDHEGFFTMPDRAEHIRDEHPGEYQGPPQDMADLFEMRPELRHEGALDDSLFEPVMEHEAALDEKALPAVAETAAEVAAPEVAAAAEVGVAGAGLLHKVVPNVVKRVTPNVVKQVVPQVVQQVAPTLAPSLVGHPDPRRDIVNKNTGEVVGKEPTAAENFAQKLKAWTDRDKAEGDAVRAQQSGMMTGAVLQDQPEPALPETYGADDEDDTTYSGYAGDPEPDVKEAAISTGVEYAVPSDPGQSGGSAAPNSNWKTDPHDLEPEDPSFVSTGSVADIVAEFQRTAGAAALDNGPGKGDSADIAAAAQQFLQKAAMATFTPAQQAELINEGKDVRAANLDRLEITGTHYEALEALQGDDDDDQEGWMA